MQRLWLAVLADASGIFLLFCGGFIDGGLQLLSQEKSFFDGAFGFSGRARVLCAVDVQDAALERPGFLVSSVRSAPGVQADCA